MAIYPDSKVVVTPATDIESPLEAFGKALEEWRAAPTPDGFDAIKENLAMLVAVSLEEAKGSGNVIHLSARIPGYPNPYVLKIKTTEDGRRAVLGNRWLTDFDEVMHTYYLTLLERLEKNPNFQITSYAYLRMGLCQRAFSLERRIKTIASREKFLEDDPMMETKGSASQNENQKGISPDPFFQKLLFQIWFYPCIEMKKIPEGFADAPGLSLRYLYTILRIQSGATTSDVSKELGVHSSRLTAVKQELVDLLPMVSKKIWLPLGSDFFPLEFSDELMHRMDLIGVNRRYGLLRKPLGSRMRGRILFSKIILWEAFSLARSLRYPGLETGLYCSDNFKELNEFTARWSLVTNISKTKCLIQDISQQKRIFPV